MFKSIVLTFSLFLSFSLLAHAAESPSPGKIKVITTLPDLAEIARTIGGDKVEVDSLLKGTEDAHFLEAVPTYIRQVAGADIVCTVGLELEIGWMPKILSKSGNSKVQAGGPGFCEVGSSVTVLDKKTTPVDRSMGDVHVYGNPHFNLSTKALSEAAVVIAKALSDTRPEYKDEFQKGLKQFQTQMIELKQKIDNKLKPVHFLARGRPLVIEYHKEFTYFFDAYGLRSFGSIEDKPGVPPSGTRLAEVAKASKEAKVCMAFGALYAPENQLQKFSEISGIVYKRLPAMVQKNIKGASGPYDSIEKLQNALADAILSCPLLSAKDKG